MNSDHMCMFHCINISWVPQKIFEHSACSLVLKQLPRDPAMVNALQNIGSLYFNCQFSAPGKVDMFTILTGDNGTSYRTAIVRWKIPTILKRNCEIIGYTIMHNATTNVSEPRHDKMCLREFPTRSDSNWPAQLQKLA